jgi:hypothetical protein
LPIAAQVRRSAGHRAKEARVDLVVVGPMRKQLLKIAVVKED